MIETNTSNTGMFDLVMAILLVNDILEWDYDSDDQYNLIKWKQMHVQR